MSDKIELGKRAVACRHWRLLPGMRIVGYDGDDAARLDVIVHETLARVTRESGSSADYSGEAWPDFDDPATLGCLEALVGEAYGKPVWLAPDTREAGDEITEWKVCRFDGCFAISVLGWSATKGEALVNALEAAGEQ